MGLAYDLWNTSGSVSIVVNNAKSYEGQIQNDEKL